MSVSLWVALIALGGVLLGQGVLLVQGALGQTADRREELLREIRWAAELACDENVRKREAGVMALRILVGSANANPEIRELVRGLMIVLVDEETETYTEETEYVEEDTNDQQYSGER